MEMGRNCQKTKTFNGIEGHESRDFYASSESNDILSWS